MFVVIVVSSLYAMPSADFDGNGEVEFADFVLFASKFGSRQGDQVYEVRYDLNSNGEIEFDDFTSFAAEFGVGTSAAKVGTDKPIDVLQAQAFEAAAKAYRDSGDYDLAVQTYTAMINQGGPSLVKVKGMHGLGTVYTKMDSLHLAEEIFKQALDEYGESTDKAVRVQMMWCSIRLGLIGESQSNRFKTLENWKKALTFIPAHN